MRPEKRLKTFVGLFILTVTFVSNSRAGSDVKTIDTARLHSMVVDNAYSLEAGRAEHFAIIASWVLYVPAGLALFAGITGICPGLIFWKKCGFK